jgi:hypothetical protein
MPGFTAGATLPRTSGRYQSAFGHASASDRVTPAMPSAANCEYACSACQRDRRHGGDPPGTCGVCNYCGQTGYGRNSPKIIYPWGGSVEGMSVRTCYWLDDGGLVQDDSLCFQEERGGPYLCPAYEYWQSDWHLYCT